MSNGAGGELCDCLVVVAVGGIVIGGWRLALFVIVDGDDVSAGLLVVHRQLQGEVATARQQLRLLLRGTSIKLETVEDSLAR